MKVVEKESIDAKLMLERWKTVYMEVREKIEITGKAARWEFDKKKLFGETEYIASVCFDIFEIVNVIYDFTNIFGPELKSILNDPERIDSVMGRVENLIVPIENADFDVFKHAYKENWEALMAYFYKEVKKLEREAVTFIDQSFRTLR